MKRQMAGFFVARRSQDVLTTHVVFPEWAATHVRGDSRTPHLPPKSLA